MTETTTTKPLTAAQRRVVRHINDGRTVSIADALGSREGETAQRRVLQALADRGLLEFHERYPWVAQRPGLNHARREAERTRREAEAQVRSQRILALSRDPMALATAVVDLEIRLASHRHYPLTEGRR